MTKENGKLPIWYRKWSNMIRRCHSPKSHNYKDYGARGITVCDRWREYGTGPQWFLKDMGLPPAGMTLGRKDNSLGYSPENCEWQTWKQQAQNRRPTGPKPDPNSLRQKCIKAGMPYMLVVIRIRDGWTEEEALTIPKLKRGGQPKGRVKAMKSEVKPIHASERIPEPSFPPSPVLASQQPSDAS